MYPIDFEKRLQEAKSRNRDVNCISATFFLLGLQDVEAGIDPWQDPESIRRKFDVIYRRATPYLDTPDEAVALGVWSNRSGLYCHLGVINPYNRDEAIHRTGYHQPISTISIEDLNAYYGLSGVSAIDFLKLR